jgi:transposase-like protein
MKKVFTPKQKAHIALEAVKGSKVMSQLASEYEAHPVQIGLWKKQLLERAAEIFLDKRKKEEQSQQQLIDQLYQTVGQRDIELAWLKKKLHLESS